VLEYATQNSVEPFLEPVLDLCHTIVVRDSQEVEAGRSDGSMMAVLLEQSGVFLELCARQDAACACAAGVCLLDMVGVYPAQCAPWLLSSESLAALITALQGEGGATVPPQLHQCLLEAVSRSVAVPGSVSKPPSRELQRLQEAVRQLLGSPDQTVKSMAGEVLHALGPHLQ
jgi:serine/threonine-protein kinase ULK4